jgi:hypothetical protein
MGLKEIEVEVGKIGERLGWHWKVGAGIAVVFSGLFVWLVNWYLPKELDNQRKQISAEIKLAIGEVLAPALQKLVLPADKIPTALVNELQAHFQTATSTADNFISAGVPVNPSALVPLQRFIRTSLETRTTLPKAVRTEGLSAYIFVRGYSLFSQNWQEQEPYSIIHVTIAGFGKAIVVGESARNKVVVYNSKIMNNGSQELDWAEWIKTDFEGTKIVYHGGDVYLADVTFKNCTFDFGEDAASQALFRKLQESQSLQKPATVVYAKTEPTLSKLSVAD